jgi:hypothetical protein
MTLNMTSNSHVGLKLASVNNLSEVLGIHCDAILCLLTLPTVVIPIGQSAVLIKLLLFKSIVPQCYLQIF